MLPHGNTAAFLEQQRLAIAEKTGKKIFSFSPLYSPLAVMPDKEYTAAEAKTILTGLRDAITGGCVISGTRNERYGSITAFFCTVTIPFLEDIRTFCANTGFTPIKGLQPFFCVGFSTEAGVECTFSANFEPHRMTVFRFGIMDFAPAAPFLQKNNKSGICGSAEYAEPLSFKWKLLSSVWKAKQKEA